MPNPAGITDVLIRSGERYTHGDLMPTDLGAIMLLGPEETPETPGLWVRQVVSPDQLQVPSTRLVTHDRLLTVENVLAATLGGLVVSTTEVTESSIAWGLYRAGRALGGTPIDEAAKGTKSLTDLAGNLFRQTGGQSPAEQAGRQAFDLISSIAALFTANLGELKSAVDRETIERAKPVRVTYAA